MKLLIILTLIGFFIFLLSVWPIQTVVIHIFCFVAVTAWSRFSEPDPTDTPFADVVFKSHQNKGEN